MVLVTGSIDFIIAPLACALGVDHVIANTLEVEKDRSTLKFTGRLVGAPVADEEKRTRILAWADDNDVDLQKSHAYGDSAADLPMLECVGNPHAVSPCDRLRARAEKAGWPILGWKEEYKATRASHKAMDELTDKLTDKLTNSAKDDDNGAATHSGQRFAGGGAA